MKVLVAVCLYMCVMPALARPGSYSRATVHPVVLQASYTRSAPARWRPISPARPRSSFRVFKYSPTSGSVETSNELNEIPPQTLDMFIGPKLTTKEARQLKYFSDLGEIPVPDHAHQLVRDMPFFDTIDHGKLVIRLQERRKYANLPPHTLKSIRPYFPFFSFH